ncbi:hypothetical protein SS50377_28372 [Spironucleus salmonicida]|uniref:BPI-like protein n=1 Tax=Spironucleus salmonicida TaxID=348837 RepID=V6M7X5_9EUKA|nr:hypothetical protein SS50377_28372 [Spironucleus salmonicida]|eukprot:EST49579.1 hypothetical protein SS50377_10081 [Spironucleus salmonicida]
MLTLLLSVQCQPVKFDNESPVLEDSAMRVFVTRYGISKYCTRNVQNAIGSIQGSISALQVQFTTLGVQITLNNGRILQVDISNMNIYLQNDSAIIKVTDVALDIVFELKLEQRSFPYLYDSGTLQLKINDFTISTYASVAFNDECKSKYTIYTRDTRVSIENFSISFQCGNQVLLNSISLFITEFLKDILNGDLGQSVGQSIMDALMKLLIEQTYYPRVDYTYPIATDQRYFNGLQITENYIIVNSTGQRCQTQQGLSWCKGYLNQTVTPTKTFFTNHDVQYQIEKLAFNSGFQLYLQEQRKIENIIIKNITLVKFHNTGAELQVIVDVDGVEHNLKYLEPVVFQVVRIKNNVDYGRFVLRLTNLISKTTLSQSQINKLSTYYENSAYMYDISYASALGVSVDKAETIYLDENWIHIGSYID